MLESSIEKRETEKIREKERVSKKERVREKGGEWEKEGLTVSEIGRESR